MTETTECAADLCNCDVVGVIETEAYCCNACREFQESGTESETCSCGHPPCDVPG